MNTSKDNKWRDGKALERYTLIAPLLEGSLDPAKRLQMREDIASRNGISLRSLYRYEAAFKKEGFSGLKPAERPKQHSAKLPDNFKEILEQAVQLKREVPTRSVNQIIYILELEGWAPAGTLKRSTMQRHLYNAGFGQKQMQMYRDARNSSSKRFCKPHRMMLIQGDIKYGIKLPIGKNGAMVQTYLSSAIDDHSRYVLHSRFYDNQEESIVEDTFHKAILKAGKFDACYFDNGSQYIARQLRFSLSRLGITIRHAPVRSGKSKGKCEKFHQIVDRFLAEVKVHNIRTLEGLNRHWSNYLEEYYHTSPHAGIREYYESMGVSVPEGGISPVQEWNRDSRPLTFLDASVVAEAFLHHEERLVDKGACISFRGKKFETRPALIGCTVGIAYDPMVPEILTVSYHGMEPFTARPLKIGAFCDKNPALPVSMQPKKRNLPACWMPWKRNRHSPCSAGQMRSRLAATERMVGIMYRSFFEMERMPFVRDVPIQELYESPAMSEALGRLAYAADRQLFAVITADAGCGKSTLLRRFSGSLSKDEYLFLYLSDSKLTPRWFYKSMLDQLGIESKFYRGDAKRQLQKEVEIIRGVQKKKVVCILDEAHLLEKETIEEFRFLLNYRFDSMSPMALILAGQTELWDKLRLQRYAAVRQRIDINCVLPHFDRAETERYILSHLVYAGGRQDIFTDRALDDIYKESTGIPRRINRICEKSLMYASQQGKRLIDEHLVRYIIEHEMLGGDV